MAPFNTPQTHHRILHHINVCGNDLEPGPYHSPSSSLETFFSAVGADFIGPRDLLNVQPAYQRSFIFPATCFLDVEQTQELELAILLACVLHIL
jgi:hypothetical protein